MFLCQSHIREWAWLKIWSTEYDLSKCENFGLNVYSFRKGKRYMIWSWVQEKMSSWNFIIVLKYLYLSNLRNLKFLYSIRVHTKMFYKLISKSIMSEQLKISNEKAQADQLLKLYFSVKMNGSHSRKSALLCDSYSKETETNNSKIVLH